MNIVFFHSNGILPNFGGISRVTDILGTLFVSKGHSVWYVGAQDKHTGETYSERQYFLPSPDLFSEVNRGFIVEFVIKNNIDAIINQDALNPNSALFLSGCKQKADFILVSCFHNSILTPIYNGAYQKEYLLKKKRFGWLFPLMKSRLVSSFMTFVYINKHRKRYMSTINNSDRVFVLCNGQVPELYRMCGMSFPDKVRVVPNGIDIHIEQEKQKEKIVLWLGTFDYSIKRPDNMLLIWKMIEEQTTEWTLYMLGDGPSWGEMKQMAKSLGLKRVLFLGRVNPDKFYQRASVSCVTSVHESFSMVILESQRVGCIPVVNNSFTSIPMLVQNGKNGYIVPAFDNKAFAKVLLSLMNNEGLLQNMRSKAIDNAAKFSLEKIYDIWMTQLNERKYEKSF